MRYLWPAGLWFLLLVPVLVAVYLALLRRRHLIALRYPDLDTVRAAAPSLSWRRHVPPALFLVAMIGAVLAFARPTAVITLPSQQRVIILAIDVSLSMRASDIQPDRITAAKDAARVFIRDLPADIRLGIVSFAGTASVVQAPTTNREDLAAAIDRLHLDRQTALGSGIVMSLAALFPDDEAIALAALAPAWRQPAAEAMKPPARKGPQKKFEPVEPGSNQNAAIILLTDGRRTTGPLPADAARMAAERGIKVYTVGFGTSEGAMAPVEGYSIYMAFDEESLRTIADITKAEYFHAASGAELVRIYEGLTSKLVMNREQTEIGFLFGAASALLLAVSGALSLLWFNRSL